MSSSCLGNRGRICSVGKSAYCRVGGRGFGVFHLLHISSPCIKSRKSTNKVCVCKKIWKRVKSATIPCLLHINNSAHTLVIKNLSLFTLCNYNCCSNKELNNNNELYLPDHTSSYSIAKAMFRDQNYNTGQLRYFDDNLSRTSKQAEIHFMNCILIK